MQRSCSIHTLPSGSRRNVLLCSNCVNLTRYVNPHIAMSSQQYLQTCFVLNFYLRILYLTWYYLQIKWPCVDTQHSTTPFVDDIYDRLKETLTEYDAVIRRWPEYLFSLETVCTNIALQILHLQVL